jgi:hypothetical protein
VEVRYKCVEKGRVGPTLRVKLGLLLLGKYFLKHTVKQLILSTVCNFRIKTSGQ